MDQSTSAVHRLIMIIVIGFTLALRSSCANAGDSSAIQDLKAKATAGDIIAQLSLAHAYDFGKGVRQSRSEAARWYEAAAQQGNAEAQNSIGSLYLAGEGVSKDAVKACDWFAKSASGEDRQGIGNLGYCYDFGVGVKQDRAKAATLYEQAASAGDVQSMLNIGVDYWQGVGVERDLAKSYMWLDLARFYTQTGNANRTLKWRARGALDVMKKQMTSDDKARGESLAREWDKANRAKVRTSSVY